MSEPIRPIDPEVQDGETAFEQSLRPTQLAEFVGQRPLVEKLSVYVEAARRRGGALDHTLLSGPPGLGKTTLAHILAAELQVDVHVTSGPAIERKGDLAGLLTGLAPGDILFIDEIHRLPRVVEEILYPAMEDYFFDFVTGTGPAARSIKIPLEPFTLLGATTRTGLLTAPMRSRFGIIERLTYYDPEDLAAIIARSAHILGVQVEPDGVLAIARRARGTPRVANRLLRRVRDFAEVEAEGRVTGPDAEGWLERLEVDALGLDAMDRRILEIIVDKFEGGPVGLGTVAAAVGEAADTLEEVYEPFLIQEGLLQRTPRGRVATAAAWRHLGRPYRPGGQGSLI